MPRPKRKSNHFALRGKGGDKKAINCVCIIWTVPNWSWQFEHEQLFTNLQFKQCFVERPGEKYIQEVLMDQSQAKYPTTKPEPVEVVVHEC